MQTKIHDITYKKGKTWIATGIVSGAMLFTLGSVTAQADEQVMSESIAKMTAHTTPSRGAASTTAPKNSANQQHEQVPAVIEESGLLTSTVKEPQAERTTSDNVKPNNGELVAEMSAERVVHKGKTTKAVRTKVKTPKADKDTTTIDQWMPNKILQELVLKHLHKLDNADKSWNSVADITQDDMLLLKRFEATGEDKIDTYIDGKTEFSLEGLQYATNLEVLEMGATLNMEPGAFFGDIVDISVLRNLKKLKVVNLSHNRIEDITPLADLENVTDMQLVYNHIRDFSPLKGKNYESFGSKGQFVMLDPIMVSDKDRTGHLKVQCLDRNGQVVPLKAGKLIAEPVFFSEAGRFTYRVYHTGGNPVPDGEGGINYSYIQDQKPGADSLPEFANMNVTIDVQKDYYYLTGKSEPTADISDFHVVQPYTLATTAAKVTVHFQDESGKAIAEDEVLPEKLVGEDYTTTAKAIDGYTLLKTPVNATGKYGEKPTDVIYVYAKKSDPVKPPLVTPPTEPIKQTTVTVHHQTADGKLVAVNQVLAGKPGEAYTTQPATPDGYKLVVTPANANGKFGDSDTTVTYIYEAVSSESDGDDGEATGNQPNPVTPGDDDTGTDETETDDTVTSDDGSSDLHHTGNEAIGQGSLDHLVEDQADPETTPNPITGSISPLSSPSTPSSDQSAAAELPQTGERQTSALWGIALLVTLYSLLGIKRKMK
ncbi:MucBP domain-containing protein [Levilactobacillus fuyuanensis]|nr:MucBP domain-containing protein [Levilactobacillus fuyuanensis]